MNIGIDISVLQVAKAGVWNYHFNLLESLIRAAPESDNLILLDCPSIHGQARALNAVHNLTDDRTTVRRVGGMRHRKLARMPALQGTSLYPLAQGADQLLDRPWGWAAESLLRRQIAAKAADLDVLHGSDVFNFEIPGGKTVITIHDLTSLLYPEFHTAENIALLARKHRFARDRADMIIADSYATKQDIVHHLDIEPQRIRVVYLGVDSAFRPVPKRVRELELARRQLRDGGYLLYLGTIEPRKNVIRLLNAFDRIRHVLAEPGMKLVLAGSMGWKPEEFLAELEALDLGSDVFLLGPVGREELPALYSGARAFVYPSLYEGFGLPPLEAMACGTPVITSNRSSLPEVVGDAAVLIDPLDTEDLAQAMLGLVTDSEWRARLRDAGLERVRQFTWDRTAKETLQVYNDAAGH